MNVQKINEKTFDILNFYKYINSIEKICVINKYFFHQIKNISCNKNKILF